MNETLVVMWYAFVSLTFGEPPGEYSFSIEQRFEKHHTCIVAAQEWVNGQEVPENGSFSVFCKPRAVDLKAEWAARRSKK